MKQSFSLMFGLMSWLVCFGCSIAVTSPASADDAQFTCKVHGGSFVLTDADFVALTPRALSKETFATLPDTSPRRIAACDSRKLSRLLNANIATQCDIDVYYKNYAVAYLDKSSLDALQRLFELPAQDDKAKCKDPG